MRTAVMVVLLRCSQRTAAGPACPGLVRATRTRRTRFAAPPTAEIEWTEAWFQSPENICGFRRLVCFPFTQELHFQPSGRLRKSGNRGSGVHPSAAGAG